MGGFAAGLFALGVEKVRRGLKRFRRLIGFNGLDVWG